MNNRLWFITNYAKESKSLGTSFLYDFYHVFARQGIVRIGTSLVR
jgi:hypothetical protein